MMRALKFHIMTIEKAKEIQQATAKKNHVDSAVMALAEKDSWIDLSIVISDDEEESAAFVPQLHPDIHHRVKSAILAEMLKIQEETDVKFLNL